MPVDSSKVEMQVECEEENHSLTCSSLQPILKEESSDFHHQDDLNPKKRGSESAQAAQRAKQNSLAEAKPDVQKLESKLEGTHSTLPSELFASCEAHLRPQPANLP